MDRITNPPLESLLRQLNLLDSDFAVVSKVLNTSHLLLSNITLDIQPAMTAATYTPYYLSIQYSRTDSASNSSSTRINKLLSMFAFLKSSPNISTDSFNKHIINKTPSNNSISLNPIKNAPSPPHHSSVDVLRT